MASITDAQGMTSSMTYVTADGGLNYRLAIADDALRDNAIRVSGRQRLHSGPSPELLCLRHFIRGFVVQDTNTMPVYVGENNVNHAIMVTHPNASKELYYYCGVTNGSQVPASLPVSQAVLDAAGAGWVDNGGEAGRRRCWGGTASTGTGRRRRCCPCR